MITKIHIKRCIVISGMIAFLLAIILVGVIILCKKADGAVESLEFADYSDFVSDVEGAVGTIKDVNGEILWSENFRGDVSTYNLIGDPDLNVSENTVSNRNKQYLTNAKEYNFWEGVESLRGTAMDINTTLDYQVNKAVYSYLVEHGVSNGSVLLLDTKTGAIKCAVSLPAAAPGIPIRELEDGALLNKNFRTTIPGSCMKILTGMLLTELGVSDSVVVCDGNYELPNGGASITCITNRGEHNLESAIGVSCNCYFADRVVEVLNPNSKYICSRLNELGIHEQQVEKVMEGGGLNYISSMSGYTGKNSFESVWSLIGEGKVQMSPLQMCSIVGGIVNDGIGKVPYILESVTNQSNEIVVSNDVKEFEVTTKETANTFYEVWKAAYETYYSTEYHKDITLAKSGTAEYINKSVSKNLIGYIEPKNLIFFVEISDYEQSKLMPYEIVNYICDMDVR